MTTYDAIDDLGDTSAEYPLTHAQSDLLYRADDGDRIGSMRMIGTANDFGGQLSVMEGLIGARQLLTPHTHLFEDQAVFVIDGALEFEVGGRNGLRFRASAGDYVLKPRGVKHGFWNTGNDTARYIELSGGGNFEDFVRRTGEQSNIATFVSSPRAFGVTFHPADAARLVAKHRLTGVVGFGEER